MKVKPTVGDDLGYGGTTLSGGGDDHGGDGSDDHVGGGGSKDWGLISRSCC